jgi:hypothetical protein
MKLNISVDCTPEEARAFLGLPNVESLNDALVDAMKQRIEKNIDLIEPQAFLKQWYAMGGQATDQFMQMMARGVGAATGGGKASKK